MNRQMVSMLAIALFLFSGCAASGPKLASSAEDIVGTWRSTVSSAEGQFNADGTFRTQTSDGNIDTGKFWFEGTRYFEQASVYCDVGNPIGIYEVELLENGNLKFTVIEDECATRVNYIVGRLIEVEWEPVP